MNRYVAVSASIILVFLAVGVPLAAWLVASLRARQSNAQMNPVKELPFARSTFNQELIDKYSVLSAHLISNFVELRRANKSTFVNRGRDAEEA